MRSIHLLNELKKQMIELTAKVIEHSFNSLELLMRIFIQP